MTQARMIPTRSGKLVDVNQTRREPDGIWGWAVDWDRDLKKTVAVSVWIPIGDVA
jgi:hypothetical protein